MSEKCPVCFRHCQPPEGGLGICRGRRMVNGKMVPDNYGKLTCLALDPIEKKPLRNFFPGSKILSVGSFGCNLSCPFCQNYQKSTACSDDVVTKDYSPEELCELAVSLKDRGNIGVAYTYNEPMISYEYVRDTAKLVHEAGMKNVLVTNGTACKEVTDEVLHYMDAVNVDLKGYNYTYYKTLGGDLQIVLKFIEQAVQQCHVEVTTLVVPGQSDNEATIRMISAWIETLSHKYVADIPLHITRFFPAYKEIDRNPTAVETVYHLVDVAKEKLKYVYPGNC